MSLRQPGDSQPKTLWGRRGWRALVTVAIVLLMLTSGTAAQGAGEAPVPAEMVTAPGWDLEPFDPGAPSVFMVEANSGAVLFSKDADAAHGPASLAKVMTVYLALQDIAQGRITLEDEVTVSEAAWRLGGSSMFLDVGDSVTVEQLLYGVGVVSGNDAARALGEHLGSGSVSSFVRRMNATAQELGMAGTRFANPSGLPAEGDPHEITAHDMAILARSLITRYPDSLVYFQKESYTYGIDTPQYNRNGLLQEDDRVTGLKTGHTSSSGFHLVGTANTDDMDLVAVVMGIETGDGTNRDVQEGTRRREAAVQQLLNYGFRQFRNVEVGWQDLVDTPVRVWKGQGEEVELTAPRTPIITIPRGEEEAVEVEAQVEAPLQAPVEAGEQLGTLLIRYDGEELERLQLQAASDVQRGGFFTVVWDSLRLFFNGIFESG